MMLLMRFKRLLLHCLVSLHLLHAFVAAQDCYYPNGDLSSTDAPCSSEDGAACCPLNWQCLDNGLCYLDAEKYFGRYTCTDKSWQSPACPKYCTTDFTDSGNQAVQQCSNHGNQYCCDHNRDPKNYCCNENDDSLFFALPQGNPTASIAALGTPAVASGGSGGGGGGGGVGGSAPPAPSSEEAPPASTNKPDDPPKSDDKDDPPEDPTTTSAPSPTNQPSPTTDTPTNSPSQTPQNTEPRTLFVTSTSLPTSIRSTDVRSSTASSDGRTSIVLLTSIITTPASADPQVISSPSTSPPSSSPSSSSSSTTAAAIGGSIGGVLGLLILISLLAFCLLRRRRRRKAKEIEDATMHRPQPFLADQKEEGLEYMYKGTPATGTTVEGSPELDGREVGAVGAVGGFERRAGGARPGEATRVEAGGKEKEKEALGVGVGTGGLVEAGEGRVPRDKWEAYELAADKGR